MDLDLIYDAESPKGSSMMDRLSNFARSMPGTAEGCRLTLFKQHAQNCPRYLLESSTSGLTSRQLAVLDLCLKDADVFPIQPICFMKKKKGTIR